MARVLFIGAGLDAASWRFRVAQYLPSLRAHGVEADVADVRAPLPQRLRVLGSAARYDLVCIHRVMLSPIELLWLRRAARRYVFDFDDAIMLRDSGARGFDSWQRRRGFARMVRGAHAVIAGNRYLGEWARRYSDRVTVIPTAVDLGAYSKTPGAAEPVVGWIGSRSTLRYLRDLVPALRRLAARRPELELRVVCDAMFAAPDVRVANRRWSERGEASELGAVQIGIMPLPDDPWTRGKCGVKILQYFAARLPVVCSPVGVNRDIVDHGRSGFHAASADEWLERLDELLGDAGLRRRFGEHGRAVVEQRYSVEAVLPRLLEVLSQP